MTSVVDQSDALSRLIPSRVARGFAVAVISGLFFTGLNGSVKALTHDMSPLLVSWGRWLAGIAVILPIVLWQAGIPGLRTRSLKMHVFRGVFHFGGYALWYEAVVSLPLATTASGLPQGMMFSAGAGREGRLIELAYELEEASPFASIQA